VRFLRVTERAGRYAVELGETATPIPAAGEVLVRVAGSGVNRADLSQIAGRYPPPPGESEILGLELSGWLAETGAPVCALVAGGGHAEFAAVPTGQLFPAPPTIDLVPAAGIPEAYLTAFVNLVVEAGLAAGQRVLIHAGASGVGLAAIELARFLGAEVAATTRSPEKVAALRTAGAQLALLTPGDDTVAVIEAAWGRDAVDVVLDPISGPGLEQNLRVIALGGRIVVISTMGGARPEIDLALLMRKRGRVIGSTLRARPRPEKARIVSRFREEVLMGFDAGRLHVVVDAVVPPERGGEVLQRMRDNRSTGKLLIDWTGQNGADAAGRSGHHGP
jgi:putative PIG3 family NAD(P)H quinone oxidoreductase